LEYVNAKEVLPPRLVSELQKYASGQLLYIPRSENRKGWGSLSGARRELDRRNTNIVNESRQGTSVDDLALRFFLSPETIKKIIYQKK
jgi:DNA-binding NarL/FixJ family response regulator